MFDSATLQGFLSAMEKKGMCGKCGGSSCPTKHKVMKGVTKKAHVMVKAAQARPFEPATIDMYPIMFKLAFSLYPQGLGIQPRKQKDDIWSWL